MSTVIGDFSARDVLPARRERVTRTTRVHPAVALLRLCLITPFGFMTPEVIAAVRGRPDAIDHLVASSADTLGNAGFVIFMVMMAVTPLCTVSGWRRHLVLRRDYGIAMFMVALTDLVIAAAVTSSEFPGGLMTRVTGHSFLAAGTLATLLCLPLVLTANRRAQRSLGKYWKPLHRTVYVVWVAILIHLVLLFGLRGPAVKSLVVSAPLLVLRLPRVRRWFVTNRRAGTRRRLRLVTGVLAAGVFAVGLAPFVQDFVTSGTGAFTQHPADG
ncbi:MAG TPA: ferric reductase-like transmembrane domain-containing protein [Mycobacteriales bacterium]|nr:ferric reductase-like transmembrane domain-containing protein [Mycobacteriales bacterium]